MTSYTDSPVTNGTTYYYEVSAVNSVGEGAVSNERSATPAASSVIVSDQFERTVSSGFGTADVGGPWNVSSTARTKVTGGQGVIYGFTGGNQDVQAWNPTTATNMEVVGLVQLNASNPVGGNYQARLVARAQTDARNGYVARIVHTTCRGCHLGARPRRQRRRHELDHARSGNAALLGGGRLALVDPPAYERHDHPGAILARRHGRAGGLDRDGDGQLLDERTGRARRPDRGRPQKPVPTDRVRQFPSRPIWASTVRRLASPRRAAVVLTLAIAASVALSGQSSAVNAASSTSFQPLADSYVSQKNPSKNFGAETRLYIRTGPIMRSYLRFSVSGLPANATVASATLQLYSAFGLANCSRGPPSCQHELGRGNYHLQQRARLRRAGNRLERPVPGRSVALARRDAARGGERRRQPGADVDE